MAISNAILSSTLRILKDDMVNNLYKSVPLLDEIKSAGGVKEEDGGQKISLPLGLADHSSITQLSSGYEAINLSSADVLRTANYSWADSAIPLILTWKEERSNSGPRAIVSIAEARLKSVMQQFRREAELQLVAGTSTVLTDLGSLNGTTTSGLSTGLLEGLAFGSQTNTVGGIDKTNFQDDYQNQYDASISALWSGMASNIVVSALTNVYVACQQRSPDGKAPNLILCSNEFFKAYKSTLYSQQRFIDAKTLDGGVLSLAFHGAKVIASPVLTQVRSDAGTNYIAAMCLNTDMFNLIFDKNANFEMTDFQDATGYASRYAYILNRCQIVAHHLASSGLIVWATANDA